ncbi:hypothetical protein [Tolypothrix sp. VBCCA 56010]|uniref:hypothetical protein n=1 Tax=Tolypothrix sp. VBCCA 56010 TaxID=3137731 RepID=UPI003D7CD001
MDVFQILFAKTIVNEPIGAGTWFMDENSSYRYYQTALRGSGVLNPNKQRFRFAEIDRETNAEKVFFDVEYFTHPGGRVVSAIAQPIRAFKNAFLISDTTGVLYAQDYQDIPVNYEVNCISCASGLTAIKGEAGKITCIDAPKVISGVNQANSKLREIYGN